STPPENATVTRVMARSRATSRSYLAVSAVSAIAAIRAPARPARPAAPWGAREPGRTHLAKRHKGARPHGVDALGGAQRAEPPARRQVESLGEPVEHSRGVEIARAGGVDHRLDRMRLDHVHPIALHQDRALRAPGQRGQLAVAAHAR